MKRLNLLFFIIILGISFTFLNSNCYAQVENRLNEADVLSQKGEFDKADNIYSQILLAEPNNERALTGRGFNSLANKHYAIAEADFQKAYQLNPQNMDALTGLADVLSKNGKYAEAEQKFNIVLGKSSTNYKALEGRAYNNLWSGKYAGATNDFTLLIEADVKKKEFYRALANINSYTNPVVWEVGGSIGGMNCFTDLGGNKGVGKKFVKDFNLKNTRPVIGAFAKVTYQNIISAKAELSYGMVTAYDSILKSVGPSTYHRYERNLSFKSSIYELSITGEFYPLAISRDFDEDVATANGGLKWSPYISLGFGIYHFNPKAKLGNLWVPLKPLHTEGEGFAETGRKNYKLTQINFPVGIGVKHKLNYKFNLSAEFVYRFLTTDYLDDVSTTYIDPELFAKHLSGTELARALALYDRHIRTNPNEHFTNDNRGNSGNKDGYFSLNVKLAMVLGRVKIIPGER